MRNTALRLLLAAILSFSLSLTLVGCGDDDKSIPRQYCEKLQDCNYGTPGITVDSCTETGEKGWNLLTSAKRTDCENAAKNCIAKADCTNFANCVGTMPTSCF